MDVGPNWDMGIRNWDASYYRDACPQELYKYQERYYSHRNMSEDCLHLNIFAPNVSQSCRVGELCSRLAQAKPNVNIRLAVAIFVPNIIINFFKPWEILGN